MSIQTRTHKISSAILGLAFSQLSACTTPPPTPRPATTDSVVIGSADHDVPVMVDASPPVAPPIDTGAAVGAAPYVAGAP
jgi:hypothetical protein